MKQRRFLVSAGIPGVGILYTFIALLWAGGAHAVSVSYDPADGTLSAGGTIYTSDVIPIGGTVDFGDPLDIWITLDRHLLFVDSGGIPEEIRSISLFVSNLSPFPDSENDPQTWSVDVLLTGPVPFGYTDGDVFCLNSGGGSCNPTRSIVDLTGDDITDTIFKMTDLHLTITVLECVFCETYSIDSLRFTAAADSFDIPEPGTLGLLGAGLTAMGLFWRRRRPRRLG